MVSFRAQCPFYTQQHMSNTKDTVDGVSWCSASFLHAPVHVEHKETPSMVSFHAWRSFYTQVPTVHAKHKETLSTVSFRAWHSFYIHQCTSNMKRNQQWCLFVLDTLSTSPKTCRLPITFCRIIIILLNTFIYIINNFILKPVRLAAGIPHPWSRDRFSVGTGAGEHKTPRGTPVCITN
jgi:hypothetical protein